MRATGAGEARPKRIEFGRLVQPRRLRTKCGDLLGELPQFRRHAVPSALQVRGVVRRDQLGDPAPDRTRPGRRGLPTRSPVLNQPDVRHQGAVGLLVLAFAERRRTMGEVGTGHHSQEQKHQDRHDELAGAGRGAGAQGQGGPDEQSTKPGGDWDAATPVLTLRQAVQLAEEPALEVGPSYHHCRDQAGQDPLQPLHLHHDADRRLHQARQRGHAEPEDGEPSGANRPRRVVRRGASRVLGVAQRVPAVVPGGHLLGGHAPVVIGPALPLFLLFALTASQQFLDERRVLGAVRDDGGGSAIPWFRACRLASGARIDVASVFFMCLFLSV